MSRECPFDWFDGKNDKLSGGRVLATSDHRFAYGFFDGDGRLKNAFIAGKSHGEDILSLLTTYPAELAQMLQATLNFMGKVDGYNVYANEGAVAGMTVGNHAHLHVIRRNVGDAAAGMGLGKLVTEYDKLSLAYDKLAWTSST